MLTDADLELLTAFVDGELTQLERKVVVRLLNRSSEARGVLRELQENAHKVRILPYHKLPAEFANQVVQALGDLPIQPVQSTLAHPVSPPHEPDFATPPLTPVRAGSRPRFPRVLAYAAAAALLFVAVGLGVLIGRRGGNDGPPIAVQPPKAQPFQITFQDLGNASKRTDLAQALKKDNALNLDVTVKSNAKAVERLQGVLQERDIQLLVDGQVEAVMKKGKGQILVYLENVQPDEVVEILQRLGMDNKQAQQTSASTFQTVQVAALSDDDRATVADALGVPISELAAPRRKEGDAASKDNKKKPAPPQSKNAERLAMAFAPSGGSGASLSSEAKMFLAQRQELRPGAVQVLLVIHQA